MAEQTKEQSVNILNAIQTKLEAPKGQVNNFGGYKYRSAEDILDALKPHLQYYGVSVTLSDEVVEIGEPRTYVSKTIEEKKTSRKVVSDNISDGDEAKAPAAPNIIPEETRTETVTERTATRIYVKATARLLQENEVIAETTAYAREEESKKGMDGAQITGAASSYARKYALNGLFAIDDTKDADTMDNTKQTTENKAEKFITEIAKIETIEGLENYYKKNKSKYPKSGLVQALGDRKKELKK